MLPATFLTTAVDPAFTLLPETMRAPEASALLLAIALQESALLHRRQFAGPARSYLQFEVAGIEGVLTHEQTWVYARAACLDLDLIPTAQSVHLAIEFHDVLACVFGRLLLWTLPRPLPQRDDADEGWEQYRKLWRPGRARPERWNANYVEAWKYIELKGLSV